MKYSLRIFKAIEPPQKSGIVFYFIFVFHIKAFKSTENGCGELTSAAARWVSYRRRERDARSCGYPPGFEKSSGPGRGHETVRSVRASLRNSFRRRFEAVSWARGDVAVEETQGVGKRGARRMRRQWLWVTEERNTRREAVNKRVVMLAVRSQWRSLLCGRRSVDTPFLPPSLSLSVTVNHVVWDAQRSALSTHVSLCENMSESFSLALSTVIKDECT